MSYMLNLFINDGISLYITKVMPNIFISTFVAIAYIYALEAMNVISIPIILLSIIPFFLVIFALALIFEVRAVKALNAKYKYTTNAITAKLVFIAQINLLIVNILFLVLQIIPVLGIIISFMTTILAPVVFEQFYLKALTRGKISLSTKDLLPAINKHFGFSLKLFLLTIVILLAIVGSGFLVAVSSYFLIVVLIAVLFFQAYQTGIMYAYFMEHQTINEEAVALNNDEY